MHLRAVFFCFVLFWFFFFLHCSPVEAILTITDNMAQAKLLWMESQVLILFLMSTHSLRSQQNILIKNKTVFSKALLL